jgi:peptidoglycan/xylan/chitin deacetylase (PgdA/CDA1 family)
VVVVGVWMRVVHQRSQATSSAPKTTATASAAATTASSATASKLAKKEATGATPPATPEVPSQAAVGAVAAGSRAVRRAAVPFPGAPALPASTKSINHLHPKHKYVAITLDDGYGFQPKMLDLLESYDAHCTTFLIGSWAANNKSILRRLNQDGFEIANHTWDHKALTKLSSAQIESELAKTQTVISSVTHNQAPYLRPPGGASNNHVRQVAADKGYRVIMWDRTFGDSGRGPTPAKLYDNAMVMGGGIKPGDIILCHWGSKISYQAMKRVLADLKAQGYQCVTISELIADSTATM